MHPQPPTKKKRKKKSNPIKASSSRFLYEFKIWFLETSLNLTVLIEPLAFCFEHTLQALNIQKHIIRKNGWLHYNHETDDQQMKHTKKEQLQGDIKDSKIQNVDGERRLKKLTWWGNRRERLQEPLPARKKPWK